MSRREPHVFKAPEDGAKVFNETHAHGVRELITDEAKLARFGE